MSMQEAIQDFAKQFSWEPRIENGRELKRTGKFVVAGMGGSHLGAGLISAWKPTIDLIIHRDYGLPERARSDLRTRLFIASSYSGNTEETLDAFDKARRARIPLAAVSIGGKLLTRAKRYGVPYIQMPNTGIQPRSALGFNILALLKFIGDRDATSEAKMLAKTLRPVVYEAAGSKLARRLKDHVPIIYSSTRNYALAYNWKIKFNETGKIPAFYNVLSELNHNEMTGFDVKSKSRHLSRMFHFIFLADSHDHPRIQRRMQILNRLYSKRRLPIEVISLRGRNWFMRTFSSLVLADWAAFYTAKMYGLEPEQVPMVEEFKNLVK